MSDTVDLAGFLPPWATVGVAVVVAMTAAMVIVGTGTRPTRAGDRSRPERSDRRARTLPTVLRSDELVVRFRPVQRLADGRTAAVEALPVWLHPGLGPIDGSALHALIQQEDWGLAFDLELLDRCLPQLPSVLSLSEVDEPWLAVPVRVASLQDPRFVSAIGEALTSWQSTGDGLALVLDALPRDSAGWSAAQRLQDLGVWIVMPGPTHGAEPWHPAIDPDLVTVACRAASRHDGGWIADLGVARSTGAPVVVTGLDTADDAMSARRSGAAFGMGDAVGRPSSLAELFGLVDTGPDDL